MCPDCVARHAIEPETESELVQCPSPIEALPAMPRAQKLILAAKAEIASRILDQRVCVFFIRLDATLPSPAVPPSATNHAITQSTGLVCQ